MAAPTSDTTSESRFANAIMKILALERDQSSDTRDQSTPVGKSVRDEWSERIQEAGEGRKSPF